MPLGTDLPLHLVFGAMLCAAFLKGVTGLGFSTICLGLLANVIDLRLAIPLVLVPSLTSNLLVMRQAGHFVESLHRFRGLFAASVPGLVAGLWLLGTAPAPALGALLGAVLIAYALFALANPSFRLSPTWATRLAAPTGLLTGLVNGATGSQVMPVLPFLMSLRLHRDLLVQSINMSFTLGSCVMLAGLAGLGLLDVGVLALSVLGVVPVWLGIAAGGWVRRRLPEQLFRVGVLLMLCGLGANLLRPWAGAL